MKDIHEMKSESTKYERITDILRKSEPILTGSEAFEENVMERIRNKRKVTENYNLLDCLFSWVYVGWARNGLIAASVLIIAVFVIQQSIILKRISKLEQQTISTGPSFVKSVPDDFESVFMIYSRTPSKIHLKNGRLSDKEVRQIEETINDLQSRYSNLMKLIEDNPELKQYIENKISENNKKKINL